MLRGDMCLLDDGEGVFTSWLSLDGTLAVAGLDPPTVVETWGGTERCVEFDATVAVQSIACDALSVLQDGNDLPFTIEALVVFASGAGSRALCGWGQESTTLQCWPEIAGGNWYCFRHDSGSYAGPLRPCTIDLEQFVAIRFTGTAIQVYSNGAWGTEQALDTATLAGLNRFRIGASFIGSGTYGMNGKLRMFAVKAGALSTAEIDSDRAWWEENL